MPLWLWITVIVFLSLIIGARMGYRWGYEDAIIDIASIGVNCDGRCDTCADSCGLKYYVDISREEHKNEDLHL